jgi:hypothetical protein
VKEKKGVALQRHLLCRSTKQLQICIGASVDIDILIPKHKGEGEEGCGLSRTFFMQIEQWGSASWSVRLFLEVGCEDSSYNFFYTFGGPKVLFVGGMIEEDLKHGTITLHTTKKIIKMLIDDRWKRIINAHE